MKLKELIKKYLELKENKIIYDDSEEILIVGDIHGDYNTIEKIKEYDGKILFLGDYVDRGDKGYEVLKEVLKLKIENPDRIFLLRGNHEDLKMNLYYGFYAEILEKEPECLNTLQKFYEKLPIIYVNKKLKLIGCHGCIPVVPDKIEDLVDYEYDILWSDFNWKNPYRTVPNFYRGAGYLVGLDILKKFMEKFDFDILVRGHEYFEEGYKIFEFNNKILITVFSSNVDGYFFVKKKVLKIWKTGFNILNI